MFETLKTLFFSLRWHLWHFMNDFGMVGKLALFGFFVFFMAVTAMTCNLLGLIPMFALLGAAVYWSDKRETNRGKLQQLSETQVTTEKQEEAINWWVNKHKKRD